MSTPLFHPETEIQYPYCDGQPMAESDFQRTPLIYAIEALREHFRDREDVYVSGDMFVYYEQGNPKAVVAPDVFVVVGAPDHDRLSYMLWKEPKGLDFVLEITSKGTRSEDQGPKRGTYAFMQVPEYWQFDPTSDYLTPPLQGYRLVKDNYERLPTHVAAGGGISLYSEILALELRCEGGALRFFDPATGHYLLSYSEIEQARQQAEQARQQAEQQALNEAAARKTAETRIAELEARLRALGAEGAPGKPPMKDD